MTQPLNIAIAGLGTVGAAVAQLLLTRGDLLARRAGRPLKLVAVSARDRNRDRGLDLSGVQWVDSALALATLPGVDLVCELIGGAEGVAHDLVAAALANGRHVVTANKALLARHGPALAALAEPNGRGLAFEAAVAGGIPIVKALREGLAANRIAAVAGILNGTCNFILTEMRTTGRGFDAVLADAQALGYAEADPTFDVEGIDAAHKLALLAALAFGCPPDFEGIACEGIRHVSALDIAYAGDLGYRIKLLGIARLTAEGLEQRVHPCMVPLAHPLAHVDGVLNAVVTEGDPVGMSFFEGRGAGAGPTASAVVADLIDIARGRIDPVFGVPADALAALPRAPLAAHRGAYYIRLTVLDRPGVIADVTAALRDEAVSLESMIQRGRSPEEAVPVVLITHETGEAALARALARIEALASVIETPRLIRIIEH